MCVCVCCQVERERERGKGIAFDRWNPHLCGFRQVDLACGYIFVYVVQSLLNETIALYTFMRQPIHIHFKTLSLATRHLLLLSQNHLECCYWFLSTSIYNEFGFEYGIFWIDLAIFWISHSVRSDRKKNGSIRWVLYVIVCNFSCRLMDDRLSFVVFINTIGQSIP